MATRDRSRSPMTRQKSASDDLVITQAADMVSVAQFPTLQRYIMARTGDHEMSLLLMAMTLACKATSRACAKAGIANLFGLAGEVNSTGDDQKKLDVLSNDIFIDALVNSGTCAVLISEENEDPIFVPESKRGRFIVAFDPLDGSSNIDCNVSTGTIFGIYEKKSKGKEPATMDDVLRTGNDLLVAGYCMYGSATELVITFKGHGVHRFVLDPSIGEFMHIKAHVKLPEGGGKTIYSCNEGNSQNWDAAMQSIVKKWKQGAKPYAARYVGSMEPNGKLRVLYEGFPMAMIVEAAGGAASCGMFKGRVQRMEREFQVLTDAQDEGAASNANAKLTTEGPIKQLTVQRWLPVTRATALTSVVPAEYPGGLPGALAAGGRCLVLVMAIAAMRLTNADQPGAAQIRATLSLRVEDVMQLPVKGCFSSHEAAAMANSSLARSSEGGARRRVPFPEVVPRHPSLAVPLPLLQHLRADSRFGRTGSAQPNIEEGDCGSAAVARRVRLARKLRKKRDLATHAVLLQAEVNQALLEVHELREKTEKACAVYDRMVVDLDQQRGRIRSFSETLGKAEAAHTKLVQQLHEQLDIPISIDSLLKPQDDCELIGKDLGEVERSRELHQADQGAVLKLFGDGVDKARAFQNDQGGGPAAGAPAESPQEAATGEGPGVDMAARSSLAASRRGFLRPEDVGRSGPPLVEPLGPSQTAQNNFASVAGKIYCSGAAILAPAGMGLCFLGSGAEVDSRAIASVLQRPGDAQAAVQSFIGDELGQWAIPGEAACKFVRGSKVHDSYFPSHGLAKGPEDLLAISRALRGTSAVATDSIHMGHANIIYESSLRLLRDLLADAEPGQYVYHSCHFPQSNDEIELFDELHTN
ncbi:unnamed protein product [Prorocentrum cordatum]|uniref:Fructose-1,6-bisphosphatase, cytosolic n=1 Tax=Prorocentrum cordatum TaxID=2364126 RepID=A0ABN9SFS9_9DINO|nr:unnamed protein product [Polarella glacialis]